MSEYKKYLCPQCDGFGKIFGTCFHYAVKFCDLCKGTGTVSDITLLWHKRGEALRAYRVKVLGLGLRKAAEKFNVDASNLSKMERGIIKPYNIYKKVSQWNG